jgi:hypothetical protein
MVTQPLFSANSINVISTGFHVTDNSINMLGSSPLEPMPVFVAAISVDSGSLTIGTVTGATTAVTSTAVASSPVLTGSSSLVVGTNTISDSDDGVVLVLGSAPFLAGTTSLAGSSLSVTNGTLSITSDTVLGPDTIQSFPVHGTAFFGTAHGSALTIHPGDIAFAGDGGDVVSVVPLTSVTTSAERAFVFGGAGDDTIVDVSTEDAPVPVTAVGGSGDDRFVVAGVAAAGTTFTGGPGHDLFQFSTLPLHGANATITDFSSHDAITIDVSPTFPASITFTNSGSFTTMDAVAAGGAVRLTLVGTFDPNQFHVTDDGHNQAVITYGNSDFVLS